MEDLFLISPMIFILTYSVLLHQETNRTNMKILLCLAALVALTAAYPINAKWNPHNPDIPSDLYAKYIPEEFFEYLPYVPYGEQDEGATDLVGYKYYNVLLGKGSGDAACDRQTLNPNDVISQKFYNDHICLIRGSPPKDLTAFCRDFRQGPLIYQVMLLTTDDINRLRKDLQGHQNDFYNDRYLFRPLHPGAALAHYTTDGTYSFIYCEEKKGTWIGKLKSNRYQQYVPQGTAGNPKGVYQIYHGCPPVVDYPGFKQDGTC